MRKFIRKFMRWLASFRAPKTVMDNSTDKDIRKLASYFLRKQLLYKGTSLYILELRNGARFLIDFEADKDIELRYVPKGQISSVAVITESDAPLFYRAVVLAVLIFLKRESFAEARAARRKKIKAMRYLYKYIAETYRKSLYE